VATIQEKLDIILKENAIDIEDFANCIGLPPSQVIALFEGKKKMTSSLARQIEQTFTKPNYWLALDNQLGQEGPSYDLFG